MIDFVLGLLGGGDLTIWIAGIVAAVTTALGLYFKGGSNAKRNAKIKDLEEAIKIGGKADDARKDSADDSRTGDDRLRAHDKLRD